MKEFNRRESIKSSLRLPPLYRFNPDRLDAVKPFGEPGLADAKGSVDAPSR